MNLEQYLLNKKFTLDTYYGNNKTYIKPITDIQILKVSINGNTINFVNYECIALPGFHYDNTVDFETITTFKQLKSLVEAFDTEDEPNN